METTENQPEYARFLQSLGEICEIFPEGDVLEKYYNFWKSAQPQWRRGEWGQDDTILRKYILDVDRNVWIMDLPDLP